jgi:hypothetical protein
MRHTCASRFDRILPMRVRFVVSLLALLTFTSSTRALIPPESPSMEFEALNADCIVAGIVESETLLPPPTSAPATWLRWKRLSVRVTESILGNPGPSLECWLAFDSAVSPPRALVGEEFLFLLVKGSRLAPGSASPWSDPMFTSVPWTFSQGTYSNFRHQPLPLNHSALAEIQTMTMVPFKTRQEVLDQVRKYAARPAPTVQFEYLYNPSYLGPTPGAWDEYIDVPLDGTAQNLARLWLHSPSATFRWNAIKILRHFRSASNASLLQGFAHQPTDTMADDVTRSLALSTLHDWGESIDWQRNHDQISPHGPSSMDFWASAALLLVAPVLYWRWSAQRRWPCLRRLAVGAWLTLLSFLLIVLLRSFGPLDGVEAGRWKLAAVRGNLFVMCSAHRLIPHRVPFQLEHPMTMPDIVTAFSYDWPWDSKEPSRSFLILIGDHYPEPNWGFLLWYRMPLWLLLLLALSPPPIFFVMRTIRRARNSHAQGFPVVFPSSNANTP